MMLMFLVLSVVSAFAGIKDPSNGVALTNCASCSTWNPPARFDHVYSGKLITVYLPQKQVVTVCVKVTGQFSYNQHGCSTGNVNGQCTIYVANRTFMKATPQAIRRHEIGHCNGWNKDHSN